LKAENSVEAIRVLLQCCAAQDKDEQHHTQQAFVNARLGEIELIQSFNQHFNSLYKHARLPSLPISDYAHIDQYLRALASVQHTKLQVKLEAYHTHRDSEMQAKRPTSLRITTIQLSFSALKRRPVTMLSRHHGSWFLLALVNDLFSQIDPLVVPTHCMPINIHNLQPTIKTDTPPNHLLRGLTIIHHPPTEVHSQSYVMVVAKVAIWSKIVHQPLHTIDVRCTICDFANTMRVLSPIRTPGHHGLLFLHQV
jgi:hypothetical protein